MCGICGFVGRGDAADLERMVATMRHRGPDAEGLWVDGRVHLGMRRLAIVDIETGQQPVFNEAGTLATVFNGEIYNHFELRQHLLGAGHRFRTDHSDTEVIVHLYEDHGPRFLERLNGMFAIALWDRERRELLLARDRAGIKPLYYALLGHGIVFGSEPKALLAHPAISRDPDFVALHHYFSLKNIPAPASAYKQIRQLRPGEILRWSDDGARIERWWSVHFNEDYALTEQEAAAKVRELLTDSVRLQMRSDVPIGAYLSGGIDSSSVVALMAQLGASNVETFTLTYEGGSSGKDSDRIFARQVSQQYGTRHHEHTVRYSDVPQKLDSIVECFDEPFSGVISTFFLTESIARHVKVALSGDGADELFGSYLPHRLAQPLAIAARDPSAPTPDGVNPSLISSLLSYGDEAARRMALYIADDSAKNSFYSPAMRERVGDERTETLIRLLYAQARSTDPLNRALFVDFETLLPDQVLSFVDRLSMAHSLEVRPPFLDHRLIEFAATLPGTMKITGTRVKRILKEAVRPWLPAELVDRPKEGFIMPINEWILTKLRSLVEDILSPKRLARHGLFDTDAVRAMLAAHYRGTADYGNRIWNLVMFQIWWDKYQSSRTSS